MQHAAGNRALAWLPLQIQLSRGSAAPNNGDKAEARRCGALAAMVQLDVPLSACVAVMSDGPSPDLWALVVTTPKLEITVYQVWGWKQAQIDFEMEGWAIPFTWLNTDFKLHQRLAAPVTGILGEQGRTARYVAAMFCVCA